MQHLNRYLLISLALATSALVAHNYAANLSHILISFVALSILCLAALQAVAITLQNHLLKRHPLQTFPVLHKFPPIETMQSLLFKVIWAGFLLLSLSFISAFIYLPDVLSTIPLSKLILSSLAWGLFATILYGYHRSGWSNTVIASRTLIGVLLLTIAYFGSKLIEHS